MWIGEPPRGHGISACTPDMIGEPGLCAASRPVLQSQAYALWLDDVLQAFAIGPTAIVGASLGGWLATDYAIRRPQRFERMVLL